MKKRGSLVILLILVCVLALTGCAAKEQPGKTPDAQNNAGKNEAGLLTGTWYAQIDIKNYGTIKAELYADIAPITVTNFVDLANSGFYDDLTFHRIISGFMIQGGDPKGNGTGGSGKNIQGEFSSNGIQNTLSHVRGVLSMARANDPNSASSQFFIMHEDALYLDGQYAAFGAVTEGIEIVDQICKDTPVTDSNGSVSKANQPVITSIRIKSTAP